MNYNPNQSTSYPPNQQSSQPYGQAPQTAGTPSPQGAPLPRRKRRLRWLWITLLIIVLVIGGGFTAIIVSVNNSPAKLVVQNYYKAIQAQDYATAYSYLDIQTFTLGNGQLVISMKSEQVSARRVSTLREC